MHLPHSTISAAHYIPNRSSGERCEQPRAGLGRSWRVEQEDLDDPTRLEWVGRWRAKISAVRESSIFALGRRVREKLFPRPGFCCACGDALTSERRARWGGPRCAGCRVVAGSRPLLWRLLAVALAASVGFRFGARVAPAPIDASPALAPIPAAVVGAPPVPPPPPEPLHPCGARTKKGTRCKRMVRGEGYCWQHEK
jgi:hypothetical protein